MSIDWFTFAAQLLNFILLLWLLKRFLYKPILNAIAAREKRISAELENAAEVRSEAQQQSERFQRKNEEIDRQRAALLEKARQDAQLEYQRLVEKAREDSDEFGRKRMQALQHGVENLNQSIARRVQREVFAISRKILVELASESLEERMTAAFITRLRALQAGQKSSLPSVIGSDGPLLLRSAFELPQQQRDSIQSALNEIGAADIDVRFETEPDLVSGIELLANGHKLAWSISDYLASLQKSIAEVMPSKHGVRERDADDVADGQSD